jgi:hypothetical protein
VLQADRDVQHGVELADHIGVYDLSRALGLEGLGVENRELRDLVEPFSGEV